MTEVQCEIDQLFQKFLKPITERLDNIQNREQQNEIQINELLDKLKYIEKQIAQEKQNELQIDNNKKIEIQNQKLEEQTDQVQEAKNITTSNQNIVETKAIDQQQTISKVQSSTKQKEMKPSPVQKQPSQSKIATEKQTSNFEAEQISQKGNQAQKAKPAVNPKQQQVQAQSAKPSKFKKMMIKKPNKILKYQKERRTRKRAKW